LKKIKAIIAPKVRGNEPKKKKIWLFRNPNDELLSS
jgi:hypothetical protein